MPEVNCTVGHPFGVTEPEKFSVWKDHTFGVRKKQYKKTQAKDKTPPTADVSKIPVLSGQKETVF